MSFWYCIGVAFKISFRIFLILFLVLAPALACVLFKSAWPAAAYVLTIPLYAGLAMYWEDAVW